MKSNLKCPSTGLVNKTDTSMLVANSNQAKPTWVSTCQVSDDVVAPPPPVSSLLHQKRNQNKNETNLENGKAAAQPHYLSFSWQSIAEHTGFLSKL